VLHCCSGTCSFELVKRPRLASKPRAALKSATGSAFVTGDRSLSKCFWYIPVIIDRGKYTNGTEGSGVSRKDVVVRQPIGATVTPRTTEAPSGKRRRSHRLSAHASLQTWFFPPARLNAFSPKCLISFVVEKAGRPLAVRALLVSTNSVLRLSAFDAATR
jgi:hypothetical protein